MGELAPYALSSLKERMIQVILDREDEGHLRWTPRGIYEQVQVGNADMYPESVSKAILAPFYTPEFLAELAEYRQHRYLSRLPAHMMADTISRRIIDLVYPIVVNKLESVGRGEGLLDAREARMLLKDAIGMAVEAAQNLTTPKLGDKGDKSDKPGMTLEEAEVLMSRLAPERRQVVANLIAQQLMANVNSMEGSIQVEPIEDV